MVHYGISFLKQSGFVNRGICFQRAGSSWNRPYERIEDYLKSQEIAVASEKMKPFKE